MRVIQTLDFFLLCWFIPVYAATDLQLLSVFWVTK